MRGRTAPQYNLFKMDRVSPTSARAFVLDDKCLYTTVERFEWDPRKDESNLRTHDARFAEAVTVLQDDFALTREDPEAAQEPRLVTRRYSRFEQSGEPARRCVRVP